VARRKYRADGSFYRRWCCSTAANEGHRRTDAAGNTVGCSIGTLLRDDIAMTMLKKAIGVVLADCGWTARCVSNCTEEWIRAREAGGDSVEGLENEIRQITAKKESILDAFFSKDITKDEMRLMNERYDGQLERLRERVLAAREREQLHYETAALQSDVKAYLQALAERAQDESFFRAMLDKVILYPDRHLEVQLNLLPGKWRCVLDSLADIRRRMGSERSVFAPSVPTSVRIPLTSP